MKKNLLIAACVIIGFWLLTCSRPTAPDFDNPYDERGVDYIPTAEIITSSVMSIRAVEAVSGGYFRNDYGKPVTAKGVCWSTEESPTLEDNCTNDGQGLDAYLSIMSGLEPDQTYYVRAYATNEDSTVYGGQREFRTMDGKPDLRTHQAQEVRAHSARVSGEVYGDGGATLLRWGLCYAKSPEPTIADDCLDAESSASQKTFGGEGELLSGDGTSKDGRDRHHRQSPGDFSGMGTFQDNDWSAGMPDGHSTAPGSAHQSVFESGSQESTSRQNMKDSPLKSPKKLADSDELTFNLHLEGLTPDQRYYVRTFAVNEAGASYGPEVSFTTRDGIPFLTTIEPFDITSSSAKTGGEITDDGGADITARGVCYVAGSGEPGLSDTCLESGSGTGSFEVLLEDLSPDQQYTVRAYATTQAGTIWGEAQPFFSRDGIVVLTTTEPFDIMAFSAKTGGEISDDGGAAITNRGVCYVEGSGEPGLSDTCLESGIGTGSFEVLLEGLSPDQQYTVRAYATTQAGTIWGEAQPFFSRDGIVVLTTSKPFDVTVFSAKTGGDITDDGGADIAGRGVCYVAGSGEPDLSDTCLESGSGMGSFEVLLEDLSPYQKYTVRAYAVNAVGMTWGNNESFTVYTTVVDVTSTTGRVWMDRNLGASRAASSPTDSLAYGDLYQWGRFSDGHQRRNSSIISTRIGSDQPGHGSFVVSSITPFDWRSPQNDNLWQGVDGINNPCPPGWRLPTEAEWQDEMDSWDSDNVAGAFDSPLKLAPAGYRQGVSNGSIGYVGSHGYYWSSTVSGPPARGLYFLSGNSGRSSYARNHGLSVRCIKDE